MNRYWAQDLSYPYAGTLINHFFGPFPSYHVFRQKYLGTTYYSNTMHDLIGTYCMGGEL